MNAELILLQRTSILSQRAPIDGNSLAPLASTVFGVVIGDATAQIQLHNSPRSRACPPQVCRPCREGNQQCHSRNSYLDPTPTSGTGSYKDYAAESTLRCSSIPTVSGAGHACNANNAPRKCAAAAR